MLRKQAVPAGNAHEIDRLGEGQYDGEQGEGRSAIPQDMLEQEDDVTEQRMVRINNRNYRMSECLQLQHQGQNGDNDDGVRGIAPNKLQHGAKIRLWQSISGGDAGMELPVRVPKPAYRNGASSQDLRRPEPPVVAWIPCRRQRSCSV